MLNFFVCGACNYAIYSLNLPLQSSYVSRSGVRPHHLRSRSLIIRASGGEIGDSVPIAPLQFESPTGQFLCQILQTHPHLAPAAIDQQLERLHTDQDSQKEKSSHSGQNLLYQ